ncbi:hypothetical protein HELRODRAFT_93316 [Helobdella robusta]|uniref:Uncharacterized protein n=1 Tax=Helobdella robusta TaxID=6412 RepID=T1G8V2_HELRO|nr:hypothetical protein HELRODRAFT_93316 [Helobdella robusta]ESO12487.1 hypothetical protein HELRODRAFT_93316 [Helobdella robusta]
MNELLKMNEIVEFYIEGGRSRSGKVLTPKTGLLSIVVDAYLQGLIDDCYIVPISLCYEKLVEGDFVHEQMGGGKEKETFTSALLAVFKCLQHSHGSVRVDVAQPFSLKEFVENYKLRLDSCDGDVNDDEENYYSGRKKVLKASGDCINSSDNCELSGVNLNAYDKDDANIRSLVYDLAQHISHDQCRIHSVSSTHLLTFVLLISNKKSINLDECVKKFSEYKEYLLDLGHCMSFSGDDGDVVLHAVHLLGLHLLQFIGDINSGVISINSSTETHIELSYYASTVIMLLASQCVLAHVICLVGRQNVMNVPTDSEVIQFNKDEVLEEATLMASLLQNEFIFFAPCSSLESSLKATFSNMLSNDFFHKKAEDFEEMEDEQSTKERCMRMAMYLEGEEECEYTYKEDHFEVYQVNNMKMERLLELKKALNPTIECYCVVAMNFINLINEDAIESEFIKNVRNDMSQRLTHRQSFYGESISMETMNNSLKTYERLNVVRRYKAANLRFIGLVNDFTNHKVLCNFIQHIQSFLL